MGRCLGRCLRPGLSWRGSFQGFTGFARIAMRRCGRVPVSGLGMGGFVSSAPSGVITVSELVPLPGVLRSLRRRVRVAAWSRVGFFAGFVGLVLRCVRTV